jgi:hypothetical protein
MASQPKPDPATQWIPMTATELLAIRDTPEFEIEYQRQLRALAENKRRTGERGFVELDAESLDKAWK